MRPGVHCLDNVDMESSVIEAFLDSAGWLQSRLASGRISRRDLQLLIGRCELVGASELVKLARRHTGTVSRSPNALDVHQLSDAFGTLVRQLSENRHAA